MAAVSAGMRRTLDALQAVITQSRQAEVDSLRLPFEPSAISSRFTPGAGSTTLPKITKTSEDDGVMIVYDHDAQAKKEVRLVEYNDGLHETIVSTSTFPGTVQYGKYCAV